MKKIIAAIAVIVVLASTAGFIIPKVLNGESFPTTASKEKTLAEVKVEQLTLEEKVGQMFFVCVSDETINKEDIASYGLGGYLFFSDFFKSRNPQQAAQDIASYQESASIPMLTGVDEEGGTVVRVSKYSNFRKSPFPSPQVLYKQGGLESIAKDAAEKSELLLSIGINVNLAPVCDIAPDKDDFIYPRTLGQDAKKTAQYAAEVITVMNSKRIGSALKHFPGYGGNVDTHTGIATDRRDFKQFVSNDFVPFQAGIDAGAPCVLVSHNIIDCMEKGIPASLSKKVHKVLRSELNFDGVIMTDDLIMDGVQGYSGKENIAVTAIQAGNDLLCTSDYKNQIPAVINAVKEGKISEQQITESATRILEWKNKLGLLTKED